MSATYPFIGFFEQRSNGDYDFILAVEREKMMQDEELETFLHNLSLRWDVKSLPFTSLHEIPDVLTSDDVNNPD